MKKKSKRSRDFIYLNFVRHLFSDDQNDRNRHLPPMKLGDDVTFESLGAVKEELRSWLGSESSAIKNPPANCAARDALLSVLIHSLAQELSDVGIRSRIQALLSGLNDSASDRFNS